MFYGPKPGGRPLAVSWALAVGARHPRSGVLVAASGRKYRYIFGKLIP